MTDYQASLQHHGVARGTSFQLGKTHEMPGKSKDCLSRNYQFLGPIPTIRQFGGRLELVKRPDEWMEHSAMGFLSLKGRLPFPVGVLDGTESCGLMLVFQYVVDRISNGSFPTNNRKSVMEKV